jgi:hypothetical protein
MQPAQPTRPTGCLPAKKTGARLKVTRDADSRAPRALICLRRALPQKARRNKGDRKWKNATLNSSLHASSPNNKHIPPKMPVAPPPNTRVFHREELIVWKIFSVCKSRPPSKAKRQFHTRKTPPQVFRICSGFCRLCGHFEKGVF